MVREDGMRICDRCGSEMADGFLDGDTHICEDCFEDYMDESFGKGKWMALGNGEMDEYDGYYIHTADVVGGFEGTGIFWTEWYDEYSHAKGKR